VDGLKGRDFLRVADWSSEELLAVLDLADRLKDERKRYVDVPLLPGRSIGLFLEKPSLRTRVSFELAVEQLGAHAVHLTGPEIGLGEREAARDVAYVLSRYLDAIMIRTFSQELVEEVAEHAYIPVVNGLTDTTHPCQALADAMTIRERLGGFDGVRVAWLGDGNNVCASLMLMCAKLGMGFVAATPPGYEPAPEVLEEARRAGGSPEVLEDYEKARRFDTVAMGAVTDGLNRLFSNDATPLRLARDLGLGLVDRLPRLKRFFIREAAGVAGEPPRLLRGETL